MWSKVILAPDSQLKWTYWVLGTGGLHSVIGNSGFRLKQAEYL